MKNYVQRGEVLNLTAPANVVSGQPGLIGTIFGIWTQAVASGAKGPLQVSGVVTVLKDTNLVISEGDRVFWVPGSTWVNKTLTSRVCVGRAVQTTLNTDTTVDILLGPATPSGV